MPFILWELLKWGGIIASGPLTAWFLRPQPQKIVEQVTPHLMPQLIPIILVSSAGMTIFILLVIAGIKSVLKKENEEKVVIYMLDKDKDKNKISDKDRRREVEDTKIIELPKEKRKEERYSSRKTRTIGSKIIELPKEKRKDK